MRYQCSKFQLIIVFTTHKICCTNLQQIGDINYSLWTNNTLNVCGWFITKLKAHRIKCFCFKNGHIWTEIKQNRNVLYVFMITVPNCCLFILLVTCLCCVNRSKSVIWNFSRILSTLKNWSRIIIHLFICLYLMSILTLKCDLHFHELLCSMKLE